MLKMMNPCQVPLNNYTANHLLCYDAGIAWYTCVDVLFKAIWQGFDLKEN